MVYLWLLEVLVGPHCDYRDADSVTAEAELRLVPLGAECVFLYRNGRPVFSREEADLVRREFIAPPAATVGSVLLVLTFVVRAVMTTRRVALVPADRRTAAYGFEAAALVGAAAGFVVLLSRIA